MSVIIALIPAMICLGIAAYMAIRDIDGRGWFLFAAFALAALAGKAGA